MPYCHNAFTDLHYVLTALSQVHIHILKTRSGKVFLSAKGDRSFGTFLHYISKKNIAFFSNKAQHLLGSLELLSRKNFFYRLQTNSVKSNILSLVTDVTQHSGRALYLNCFILLNTKIVFAKLPLRKYFL